MKIENHDAPWPVGAIALKLIQTCRNQGVDTKGDCLTEANYTMLVSVSVSVSASASASASASVYAY